MVKNTTNKNQVARQSTLQALIRSLPIKNQTKAQTANHIADIMATILALAYITSGAPYHLSFLLIVIVISLIFGCVWVTKPKKL